MAAAPGANGARYRLHGHVAAEYHQLRTPPPGRLAPAQLTSIGGRRRPHQTSISDGRALVLAQLALARFTNPQTLLSIGNNNFVPTSASGQPVTGPANTAGLGSVLGLSLEFSNVDIAQEFTALLTFQRGFQANSRVITTADELNQEALNLKR